VRLACLPVFLWLLFARDDQLAAGILLGVLGITDFADGYIARHFDQVSELGKVLDPTAEPTLTLVTCYPFWFVGNAPLRFVVHATVVGVDERVLP